MKVFKVNPLPFRSIHDPIHAYILGLLWADGYVKPPYQVSLTTTYPDADFFIPLFLKTGEWKHYSRQIKENWKKMCEIKTSNKELVTFLLANDYGSKSIVSAEKIVSQIPEHLQHYWLRGFFDGDGHIYTDNKGTHRMGFSGPYNQNWKHLQRYCDQFGVVGRIHKQHRKTGKSSVFMIYGKHQVIQFCDFMYKGYTQDKIGLNRKYEKLLQLKLTKEKNRFKGISEYKSGSLIGKWRAYTKGTTDFPPHHLGTFPTQKSALECVKKYYELNPDIR